MPAGCVIGVDLGGTKLLAGAVDADLAVHHRAFRSSRGGDLQEVLDTLVEAITEARDASEAPIRAVGIGIPSLVDVRRGVALSTVHLPLTDVPIRDLLAERLGVPVFVDNDATAALIAEARHGAARGARDAVLLTLGTGIGGGILAGGEIVRGAVGAAGELGHMVVVADGPACFGSCPGRGCLESVVSGSALARDARELAAAEPSSALGRAQADGRELTAALVTELAHDGDEGAGRLLRHAGEMLGVGITGLVNMLNPEVVVVGGGVMGAGELLLGPAREVVRERALPPSAAMARIVPTRFGAESGMLGAAALALDGLRA